MIEDGWRVTRSKLQADLQMAGGSNQDKFDDLMDFY
jgi:hypothetical protein